MAFKDHLPKSCCCGCTLKTGGKIITALEIAFSALILILFIIGLISGGTEAYGKTSQKAAFAIFVNVVPVVFRLIISSLALRGILTDNIKFIKPWLIFTVILIIAGVIYGIVNGVGLLSDADTRNTGIGQIIGGIIGALIEFYFWMVMYALYLEFQGNDNRPGVVQTQKREDTEHGVPLYGRQN